VWRMKATLLLIVAVALVGCGGDPNKKANELYVEAVQLITSAERKITPYDSPISDVRSSWEGLKEYEQALDNLQKILDDYSESDLAVKLISGETLAAKKSLEAIEARVSKLKKELVVPNNNKALLAIQSAWCEALGKSKRAKLTEADYERITSLTLDNDQITDISVLLLCTNLKQLTLKNTQIKKLTTLTKLKSLSRVILEKNPNLTENEVWKLRRSKNGPSVIYDSDTGDRN
jgi:hypothetical protein